MLLVSFEGIADSPTEEPTIEQMAAAYFVYAQRCDSYTEIRARYRRYFEPIKDFKASALTPQHVERWHVAVRDHVIENTIARGEDIKDTTGHGTANHALRLLRVIFTHAFKKSIYKGENPAKAISAFKEIPRDQYIDKDEMPDFLKAVGQLPAKVRDLIYLMLFTGVRGKWCREVRWEDINLTEATWKIRKYKGQDLFICQLDLCAIEALTRRGPKATGFVFPSDKHTGPMAFPRRHWEKLRKKFPKRFVAHDLRATFVTWQLDAGVPLEMVQDSVGHKSIQSTRIYDRNRTKRARKGIRLACELMTSLTPPDDAA